jgi:hypothetical protein
LIEIGKVLTDHGTPLRLIGYVPADVAVGAISWQAKCKHVGSRLAQGWLLARYRFMASTWVQERTKIKEDSMRAM